MNVTEQGSSIMDDATAGVIATRSKLVWAALAGAMTVVGALMWTLEGRGLPRTDGLALAKQAGPGVSSIEAIFQTRADLDQDRWKAIVIHHSGSPAGTPQSIENEQRADHLAGLGYDFVIGNGRGIGDGEVHVGYRWLDQLPGAHVGGPRGEWYNEHAIGICLVGDGRRGGFTEAQMTRLVELVRALRRELDLPASQVLLASDIMHVESPGPRFPEATFREQLASGGF
jgi:N-acetylmuramoyl-L-alanine amidase